MENQLSMTIFKKSEVMGVTMVELRAITEDNFLDAFHLKLAHGQENFVSHPIRSLHRKPVSAR